MEVRARFSYTQKLVQFIKGTLLLFIILMEHSEMCCDINLFLKLCAGILSCYYKTRKSMNLMISARKREHAFHTLSPHIRNKQ